MRPNINALLLLALIGALCGCTSIEQVPGAPEVHTVNPHSNASVTTTPDGLRFVVINRPGSKSVETTILLPPLPAAKIGK